MGVYGFTVWNFPRQGEDAWYVALPHQCDSWDIVPRDADPYRGSDGAPHEQAVADMELFIAEAQQALAALKAREVTE